MYKYLPTENMKCLKHSVNETINKNNISTSKVSKAMGIDTSMFKALRDEKNDKLEISPEQYINLKKFLSPHKLNIGDSPSRYKDRLAYHLYKHGFTVEEFSKEIGMGRGKLDELLYKENGVSFEYKEQFCKVLAEFEFNTLNSYTIINLSGDRDERVIKNIVGATMINNFMIKRGYTPESLATKMGYTLPQVKLILEGFITDKVIQDVSKALQLAECNFTKTDIFNSWNEDNNFGYFLQKQILSKKLNVNSASEKMGISYTDLKDIISGIRNIKENEFIPIAKTLGLDVWDLRQKAPKIELDGDDKYIIWNFIKYVNEHPEVTYKNMNNIIGRDSANLIRRIKEGRNYKAPEITQIMEITGLTRVQLRSPLTDEEIEQIRIFKKSGGRRVKNIEDNETFNSYIRNIIANKNMTLSEFAELIDIDRSDLSKMLQANRIRQNILSSILDILELDKSVIKQFNVDVYEAKKRSKKKEKSPEPSVELKEENDIESTDIPNNIIDYGKSIGFDIKSFAQKIFRKLYKSSNFDIRFDESEYEECKDISFDTDLCSSLQNAIQYLMIENGVGGTVYVYKLYPRTKYDRNWVRIFIANSVMLRKPKDSELVHEYLEKINKNYISLFHSTGFNTIDYMNKVSKDSKSETIGDMLTGGFDFNKVLTESSSTSETKTYEDVIHKDESSMIPNIMPEFNMETGEIKYKDSLASDDDKDFMMEQLDKFISLFESLKDEDQNIILRIMNTVKYNNDLGMTNIPEVCFEGSSYAEYKKLEYIVKLTGLEK